MLLLLAGLGCGDENVIRRTMRVVAVEALDVVPRVLAISTTPQLQARTATPTVARISTTPTIRPA